MLTNVVKHLTGLGSLWYVPPGAVPVINKYLLSNLQTFHRPRDIIKASIYNKTSPFFEISKFFSPQNFRYEVFVYGLFLL